MVDVRRFLTNEQVDTIADKLRGQCMLDVEQVCEQMEIDYDDVTIEDLRCLDDKVFCCELCNWWFEMSELSEDSEAGNKLLCEECA